LARLQGHLTLRALIRRVGQPTLATDVLEWNPNILVRGLKALPITFEPSLQDGS
jgi:cytochrome P450